MMTMGPSIAIFQAEWPVQSQTVNCAYMLGQAGYPVDLFLFETPIYYEFDQLVAMPNVQVHQFYRSDYGDGYARRIWRILKTRTESWPRLRTALTRLVSRSLLLPMGARELHALIQGREDGLLPEWLLHRAQAVMNGKRYKCLIGIEKKGLIWAGFIGERLGIPYIYYSLELYTRDHPESRRSFRARRTKLVEEKYHKKSVSTIIQDPERAEILLRENGVRSSNLLFVPVSLLGGTHRLRSSFLQERLQLREDQIVILNFGQICEERFSSELALIAQSFPPEWSLVLHGHGADAAVREVQAVNSGGRLLLSLDMVPARQIPELIASARVGLALYSPVPSNDLLTAFSSEKVALYLQSGLPIIAFDYPGYRRLVDRYRCGVVIVTLRELPKAVETILSSYEEFQANAYKCFTECYEFSKPFQKVLQALCDLCDSPSPPPDTMRT